MRRENLESKSIKEKREIVEKLKEDVSKWQVVLLSDFSGMSIKEMEDVRGALKESGGSFHVMGNTIIKRALKDTGFSGLADKISGPNAVAYTAANPVDLIQTLVRKTKIYENLKIKSGAFEKRLLSRDEIGAIATLPPREDLTAQLLSMLNAPLSNFMNVFNGILLKFIYVLKACEEKKDRTLGGNGNA